MSLKAAQYRSEIQKKWTEIPFRVYPDLLHIQMLQVYLNLRDFSIAVIPGSPGNLGIADILDPPGYPGTADIPGSPVTPNSGSAGIPSPL
jgi:hypothetical protein